MPLCVDYTAISRRMKELRVGAGLKQKDLSDESKIPAPNLSAYENGQRDPTLMALRYYSWKFERSLDYLIIGKEFKAKSDDETEVPDQFVAAIKNMFTFAFDNQELQDFLRKWCATHISEEVTLSQEEKELIQAYRTLDDGQKKDLLESIKE